MIGLGRVDTKPKLNNNEANQILKIPLQQISSLACSFVIIVQKFLYDMGLKFTTKSCMNVRDCKLGCNIV